VLTLPPHSEMRAAKIRSAEISQANLGLAPDLELLLILILLI